MTLRLSKSRRLAKTGEIKHSPSRHCREGECCCMVKLP